MPLCYPRPNTQKTRNWALLTVPSNNRQEIQQSLDNEEDEQKLNSNALNKISIYGIKALWAIQSSFFDELLYLTEKGPKEKEKTVIKMSNISIEAMKVVSQLVMTGSVSILPLALCGLFSSLLLPPYFVVAISAPGID